MESRVGEERAKEIKRRMPLSSRRKAKFLRGLNRNAAFLEKRAASKWRHEEVVRRLIAHLRAKGLRCYILSEYVKEERTPDAITFDGKSLTAIEVEQEKRYKASHDAIRERLEALNGKSGFFDRTRLVFVGDGVNVARLVRQSAVRIMSKD